MKKKMTTDMMETIQRKKKKNSGKGLKWGRDAPINFSSGITGDYKTCKKSEKNQIAYE